MPCVANTIKSSATVMRVAREECVGELPVSPVWYTLTRNSGETTGSIENESRSVITSDRQKQAGSVVDQEAGAEFQVDLTYSMFHLMAGAFFADAFEVASTQPFDATPVAITGVSATQYLAASGLDVFAANMLIAASGFLNTANNGLKTVSAAAAGSVTVDETLVAEASPPLAARLDHAGYEFATGDVNIDYTTNILKLQSTVTDFTTLVNVVPGAWVYIGGDVAGSDAFSLSGYARVFEVTANELSFDHASFSLTESGAGIALKFFIGAYVRNQKGALINDPMTYAIARSLGEDDDGTQSEVARGQALNEMTVNFESRALANVDFNYIGTVKDDRTGLDGEETGTDLPINVETAVNTATDVGFLSLSILDTSNSTQQALFAYAESGSFGINNNIDRVAALGILGALDTVMGDFDSTVSLEAYFTRVASSIASRNNTTVGFVVGFASRADGRGFVFDVPNGKAKIDTITGDKDDVLKCSVELMGHENVLGYTSQAQSFAYLPQAASSAQS